MLMYFIYQKLNLFTSHLEFSTQKNETEIPRDDPKTERIY